MQADQALLRRQRQAVIVVAVDALRRLPHWTLAAGKTYTYQASMAEDVTGAFQSGTELTERSSIADVEANAASWFYDYAARILYVRPTTGSPYLYTITAAFQLRVGTVGKRDLDSKPYTAHVADPPPVRKAVDRNFGAMPSSTSGSLQLDNSDGRFNSSLLGPLVTVFAARALMMVDL